MDLRHDDGAPRNDPASVGNGRYVLGEALGSGGTARVYRSFDTHLRVPRAVKLLRGDRAFRDELRPRLHAEARVMASLRHPNVLAVYDFGAEPDCDWVVMELAEGGSLDDRLLREGRLSPADAVDYGLQILSGLAAAHAANVVHRDIKPQNVLLDARGVAHLADFGIALFTSESAQRLTQTGVSMGSFAYMPPEQRLDARSVSTAADIYAVGATLYVLLTGRTPVDLFAADPRSSRWGSIPESLSAVVRRATRFEPEDRYASALEMAEDLADAASREKLLDRTQAAGSYAIFSSTTMPRLAEATLPVAPEIPLVAREAEAPGASPGARGSTHIVPALQDTDIHPLSDVAYAPHSTMSRRADRRRKMLRIGAGVAFGIPVLFFAAFFLWRGPPAADGPAAGPTAEVVAPREAARELAVPAAPEATPAAPPLDAPASGAAVDTPASPASAGPSASNAPAAVAPSKKSEEAGTARSAPAAAPAAFRHPELVGSWSGNWGQGIAYVKIGPDGGTTGRVGVAFGGDRTEALAGRFRWDGDTLRLENTRYQGRYVTVVFDALGTEKIGGHLADSPGERITLHRER